MAKPLRKDIKFWLNVFTIGALLMLVIISRTAIIAAFKKLGQLNASALLLMIPLQAINYYAVARVYKDYFKSQGEELKMSTMYSVALELNFVNHVFPSGGVSGFSYLSLRLKQEGISTAKSTLAQIVRFALTFISFLALLFFGMLILALRRHTSPLTILISSSIAFLTLFGAVVGTYIISDQGRIKAFTGWLPKVLNKVIGVFRRHKKETIIIAKVESTMEDLHRDYMMLSQDWRSLKKPLLWALLINVSDVATIYAVYLAFGTFVNPGALIIAYAVANFAGLVAILPGGVGIYEGLMTATLTSAGVDKALALSATVVYRVLNMIYALPLGYYLYHRALKQPDHTMVRAAEVSEHRIDETKEHHDSTDTE